MVIPISAIISGVVDFLFSFLMLIFLMLLYRIAPTVNIIWLPLFLLLALATSLGVGLWLTAMNVQYRDIRYVVPFIVQIWFIATPVAYPSSMLDEPWRTLSGINPMVGVVDGFRWALLGTSDVSLGMIGISSLIALILLISGGFYFRRVEKTFADVV